VEWNRGPWIPDSGYPRDAVLPLSPLDALARRLDVHWAFMYANNLDAAILQHALAVGLGRYCPLRQSSSHTFEL